MDKILRYKKKRKSSFITFILGLLSISFSIAVLATATCNDTSGSAASACGAPLLFWILFLLGSVLSLIGLIRFITFHVKLSKSKK